MGPGHNDLGTVIAPAHVYHIHTDGLSLGVALALHLLPRCQQGIGLVGAGTNLDGHIPGIRLDPQNRSGEHLMGLGVKLVKDNPPLRLADSLNNHALGGLGGNPAKLLGLDFHVNYVSLCGRRIQLPGIHQGNFRAGEHHVLHHFLLNKELHLPVHNVHHHIFRVAGVVLFIGGQQGLGDFFQHIILGDALFPLQLFQSSHDFGIHFSDSSIQNSA